MHKRFVINIRIWKKKTFVLNFRSRHSTQASAALVCTDSPFWSFPKPFTANDHPRWDECARQVWDHQTSRKWYFRSRDSTRASAGLECRESPFWSFPKPSTANDHSGWDECARKVWGRQTSRKWSFRSRNSTRGVGRPSMHRLAVLIVFQTFQQRVVCSNNECRNYG